MFTGTTVFICSEVSKYHVNSFRNLMIILIIQFPFIDIITNYKYMFGTGLFLNIFFYFLLLKFKCNLSKCIYNIPSFEVGLEAFCTVLCFKCIVGQNIFLFIKIIFPVITFFLFVNFYINCIILHNVFTSWSH